VAKHKNCRNCRHAKFETNSAGRRNFNLRAECNAAVDLNQLPLSQYEMFRAFKDKAKCYSNDDGPMKKECPCFEPITKKEATL